jgi:hypothetical protein
MGEKGNGQDRPSLMGAFGLQVLVIKRSGKLMGIYNFGGLQIQA